MERKEGRKDVRSMEARKIGEWREKEGTSRKWPPGQSKNIYFILFYILYYILFCYFTSLSFFAKLFFSELKLESQSNLSFFP